MSWAKPPSTVGILAGRREPCWRRYAAMTTGLLARALALGFRGFVWCSETHLPEEEARGGHLPRAGSRPWHPGRTRWCPRTITSSSGLEPFLDHPEAADRPPHLHGAVDDDVLGIRLALGPFFLLVLDDVKVFPTLVGGDRIFGDQGLLSGADGQPDPGKASPGESNPGVVFGVFGLSMIASNAECPGAGINLVVAEVDRPAVRNPSSSGSRPIRHGHLRLSARFDSSFADQAADFQDGSLVDVEVDVHRVERDDGREDRLIGLHQISRVDHPATQPAGDRAP